MRNWFSNFLPFETIMVHSGIRYTTVEHFYQAMKSLQAEKRKLIADCATAADAKRAGRALQVRPDWDQVKDKVMEFALRHKFMPGTNWSKKLLACQGEIVESNYWHDNYWGACTCMRCHGLLKQNKLGKMLMKLRDEIAAM